MSDERETATKSFKDFLKEEADRRGLDASSFMTALTMALGDRLGRETNRDPQLVVPGLATIIKGVVAGMGGEVEVVAERTSLASKEEVPAPKRKLN